MNIIRGWSTDKTRNPVDPLLEKNGIFLEFRGGNFLHPTGEGKWFDKPYFKKAWSFFIKWPIIPFISWKVGSKGGYIGAKAYGVDSLTYKDWAGEENIYEGSQAIMISIRPFATIAKEKDQIDN